MSFQYKNVLVTGATSGLGLALAEKMIEVGCFVIAVARREDRLKALAEKHGADKVAAEPFDMTNLDGMPAWVEKMTKTYPKLDSIVLNAGIQRSIKFTQPSSISLPLVNQEIITNYTSPLTMSILFLPHLQSLSPAPASIILVSSGLAFVPMPRCASYCATKAAIHSLAWTMRYQLSADEGSKHVKVVEIIPPAVKTELHTQQEDLSAKGIGQIGISIEEFMEDAWTGLTEGKEEIPVGKFVKDRAENEAERGRKKIMLGMIETLKAQGMDP
ncbi:hypothetical protein MKZ38_009490 [Zalerion maritima]|uniref:Uncharacterized protein n=1 Tax=Zalerion maritima TaxID=339359 RepID=A0AAD5RGS1_9PEZI|nr:hypothetical protein MKZ38_009490 [Zalerion maritima]